MTNSTFLYSLDQRVFVKDKGEGVIKSRCEYSEDAFPNNYNIAFDDKNNYWANEAELNLI